MKLAVGYIVFEQKQIVILADEKSAAEWRRLVCRKNGNYRNKGKTAFGG